jgi:flagellar biosynthetic protein FliR
VHGAITLDAEWLTTVLLLALRLAAVLLMTPLLSTSSVPVLVRVLVVLALAAALSLGLPSVAGRPPGAAISGAGALVSAACTELALGATLALGILVAFAAFSMAGELLGIQMGIGIAQALDPSSSSGETVPLLSTVFNQVGVVVFFLVDGHHALLRGVAYSLERFPLGRGWPVDAAAGPMLGQVAGLFGLGFALAAPVVVALLLLEAALGVVARNLPQMNMLAMGIPVKILVGLLALWLWFAGIGDVMGRVYGSIFRTWTEIFPAASLERAGGREAYAAVPHPACGREGVLR